MTISSTDQMIKELESWIKSVVGTEKLFWDKTALTSDGIYLFPQNIHAEPWDKNTRSFSLDILTIPHYKKGFKALELLEKLIFSALTTQAQKLSLNSPPESLWQQLDTIAHPSITFKQTITRELKVERAVPVREALRIQWKNSEGFEGTLLDHEETPLAFEKVKLSKSRLQTQTDQNGNFYFTAIPQSKHFPKLEIRGRTIAAQSSNYPAIYQVNLLEPQLNAEL